MGAAAGFGGAGFGDELAHTAHAAFGNVGVDVGGCQSEATANRRRGIFGPDRMPQGVGFDDAVEHVEVHDRTTRKWTKVGGIGQAGRPVLNEVRLPRLARDFNGERTAGWTM